jgi:hypothetical protein
MLSFTVTAKVMDALCDCGLVRAHPDIKSMFGAKVLEYLGHNVGPFGLTPHGARFIRSSDLQHVTGRHYGPYLVIACWECTAFSSAGKGLGLDSPNARTYYDTAARLVCLRFATVVASKPPAYSLRMPLCSSISHLVNHAP